MFFKRLGIVLGYIVGIPATIIGLFGIIYLASFIPNIGTILDFIATYILLPIICFMLFIGLFLHLCTFIKWLIIEPYKNYKSRGK
jgi:ABC-type phosphate transport system permease subunit